MMLVIKGLEEDIARTQNELQFVTQSKEDQIKHVLDMFEG